MSIYGNKLENGKIQCKICLKEFAPLGICRHYRTVHLGSRDFWGPNKKIWNKGLTKDTDKRILKGIETYKSRLQNGEIKVWCSGKNLSIEHREKLSQTKILCPSGGKSKWYDVNGIKVQGTWERDFAEKLNIFKIHWMKPCFSFKYILNDKNSRYIPDFYLPKFDVFIEIKGFWWGNDKEKMRAVIKQNRSLIGRIKVIREKKFRQLLEVKTKREFLELL
jgi:hypothetical protein